MRDKIKISHEQIIARALDQSFYRGLSLYESGAIFLPARRGNQLSAMCVGSSSAAYRVTATFDESGHLTTHCTCPYDWGGDCKHIVALLLTYVLEPEVFRAGEELREELMLLEKEDLVNIVEQMITRYTGLDDIVEHMISETRNDY
ncbi:MAG: SWIM zinc finger family protein [Chloroflexi bacterium]|nr:SWIM zinc finger family protein [Chloroflexota bacterium]